MAATKMELAALLSKAEGADVDWLREGVRVLAQALMDADVSARIGATRSQRTPDRTTHRNGYRPREWDTRVGTIELAIPRLRQGSYLPCWLEPRRRAERALCAVVAQCYVEGCRPGGWMTSPARWGSTGSPSRRCLWICAELDTQVTAGRNRPLDAGPYALVWIDALDMRVRESGRICQTAVLVATGVNHDGQREILGVDIGAAEDGASWTAFLRRLVARSLTGVRLVVSDAHHGLKVAIAAVLQGVSWQLCRTH